MKAHEEKHRFILSAFSTFLSLCKRFGWIFLGCIVLIHMVGGTNIQATSPVCIVDFGENEFFSGIQSEYLKCVFDKSLRPIQVMPLIVLLWYPS